MTTVTYYPPFGEPIVLGAEGYDLVALDGLTSTLTTPITGKAPGQRGTTLLDRSVDSRTVVAQVAVYGDTEAEYHARRRALVAALSGDPGTDHSPPLGLLRVHIDGCEPYETRAEPVDSPQDVLRVDGNRANILDLEWHCPSPLWRELSDRVAVMELVDSDDPWVSPWTSPWAVSPARTTVDITNPGVPVGFVVRFWGPQTAPSLTNITTGETLAVSGAIEAGSHLDVDTDARTVTLNGASVLDRWDFDGGSWWWLAHGFQTIEASAVEAGIGARTVVLWRPAYQGL